MTCYSQGSAEAEVAPLGSVDVNHRNLEARSCFLFLRKIAATIIIPA